MHFRIARHSTFVTLDTTSRYVFVEEGAENFQDDAAPVCACSGLTDVRDFCLYESYNVYEYVLPLEADGPYLVRLLQRSLFSWSEVTKDLKH